MKEGLACIMILAEIRNHPLGAQEQGLWIYYLITLSTTGFVRQGSIPNG